MGKKVACIHCILANCKKNVCCFRNGRKGFGYSVFKEKVLASGNGHMPEN